MKKMEFVHTIVLMMVSSYGFYSTVFPVRNHPMSCLLLLLKH